MNAPFLVQSLPCPTAWKETQLTYTEKRLCKHSLPESAYSHGGMCEWLRHQFPQATYHHVEAVTGIPAATVEGWFSREYRPSLQNFMAMLCVFGPAFARACLTVDLDWLHDAERREQIAAKELEIARLEAERDELRKEAG